jgi:hypothetical protein
VMNFRGYRLLKLLRPLFPRSLRAD